MQPKGHGGSGGNGCDGVSSLDINSGVRACADCIPIPIVPTVAMATRRIIPIVFVCIIYAESIKQVDKVSRQSVGPCTLFLADMSNSNKPSVLPDPRICPQIFSVTCLTDQVVIRGSIGRSPMPLDLLLNMMICNRN